MIVQVYYDKLAGGQGAGLPSAPLPGMQPATQIACCPDAATHAAPPAHHCTVWGKLVELAKLVLCTVGCQIALHVGPACPYKNKNKNKMNLTPMQCKGR